MKIAHQKTERGLGIEPTSIVINKTSSTQLAIKLHMTEFEFIVLDSLRMSKYSVF